MSDREEAGARLIERVLSDPAFRARFRRDPEAAAQELGLDPTAAPAADPAFETLELRESKSSLAGAMLAAAVEGVGIYDMLDQLAVDGGHAVSRAVSGLGVADAAAATPSASPAALDLLQNAHVEFDADGVADLRAGRIDERIVAVLGEVSKRHEITVSAMRSDHAVQTASGGVSNHSFGRAVDIAMVDGRPVSPDNEAARDLAAQLLRLDRRIRPTELGSPWALPDPASFTDGNHQNHIHVAFDDPAEPGHAPQSAARDNADGQPGNGAGATPAAPDPSTADDDVDSAEGDDSDDEDDTDDEDDVDDDDDGGDEDDTDDEDDVDDDEDDGDDEDDTDDGDDDEPDEEEPDEVGPDQDDLTDDEVVESAGESGDPPDGDTDGDSDGGDGADRSDSGGIGNLGDVDSEYPGDDASRRQIALWMAAETQRRGLPPELPVMAALVESGMSNLPGGDADSVGFFQMRASIWNSGDYVGYAGRPELQLDWFLDHAEAVRAQRVDAGLPIDDPDQYGEWIADVERPAEQYRGRYHERLAEARELLQRSDVPANDLVDGASGDLHAGSRARAAVAEARKYLGTPYQWGGSTPKTGFDCSGLVQWAYAQEGIRIPRVTDQQILAEGASKVGRRHLLPGDLVFFRDSTGYVHHVGISLGGDRFIHAPHTGDVVKISSLDEPYYAEQFTGGRRFDPAAAAPDDKPADASEVAKVRIALERDEQEVRRPGTALFRAIAAQEEYKQNYAQVLPVIRPDQVRRS